MMLKFARATVATVNCEKCLEWRLSHPSSIVRSPVFPVSVSADL